MLVFTLIVWLIPVIMVLLIFGVIVLVAYAIFTEKKDETEKPPLGGSSCNRWVSSETFDTPQAVMSGPVH